MRGDSAVSIAGQVDVPAGSCQKAFRVNQFLAGIANRRPNGFEATRQRGASTAIISFTAIAIAAAAGCAMCGRLRVGKENPRVAGLGRCGRRPRRGTYVPMEEPSTTSGADLRRRSAPGSAHMNIGIMPNGARRSNVVVSNLRPSSRARLQEAFSSSDVVRRAISAYLSRYFALPGSQKLSGWNCAITLTGAAGVCSAIHSSTGYVQHST